MRRRSTLVLGVTALWLVSAACGGGSANPTATKAAHGRTGAASPSVTAVAAGTPSPSGPPAASSTSRPAVVATCSASDVVAYDGVGVRFSHPACWTAVHFDDMSSFSTSIVDLSNEPLVSPCTTTTGGSDTSMTCGWPLAHLDADGVLVRWSSNGDPGWSLAGQPGTSLTLAGAPAREQVERPGTCGAIGADETIAVDVALSAPSDYDAVTACLRGPDLFSETAEVQRMLGSLSLTGGD